MSDEDTSKKKPLPVVTRRRLMGFAAGYALNSTVPALPFSVKTAEADTDAVTDSFFLTPRFRELADWICINDEYDEGSNLRDIAKHMKLYGDRLLRNPPSISTIEQFLSNPTFIQSSINGDGYVVGKRSIDEVAAEIYQMCQYTSAEMDQFIAQRMAQGPQAVFRMQLIVPEQAAETCVSQAVRKVTGMAAMATVRRTGTMAIDYRPATVPSILRNPPQAPGIEWRERDASATPHTNERTGR